MVFGRRRRNRFRFTEKIHSKRGMAALGGASLSLLIYIIFVYVAFKGNGNLSMYFGSFGLLAMVAGAVSLGFAIRSLFEEDSFQLFPRLATFVGALATLAWIGTYVNGFLI